MGQITTTQNLVAIKEVRHAGQWHSNTVAMSYGWDVKSSVGDSKFLMSYGGVSKSSVWDKYIVAMSYGRDNKSYVWVSNRHLCHTEELVSRPYEIVILFAMSYGWDVKSYVWVSNGPMSYGRDSNSYVWDRWSVAMSYGWDVKSYVWLSNSGYVIRRS